MKYRRWKMRFYVLVYTKNVFSPTRNYHPWWNHDVENHLDTEKSIACLEKAVAFGSINRYLWRRGDRVSVLPSFQVSRPLMTALLSQQGLYACRVSRWAVLPLIKFGGLGHPERSYDRCLEFHLIGCSADEICYCSQEEFARNLKQKMLIRNIITEMLLWWF